MASAEPQTEKQAEGGDDGRQLPPAPGLLGKVPNHGSHGPSFTTTTWNPRMKNLLLELPLKRPENQEIGP